MKKVLTIFAILLTSVSLFAQTNDQAPLTPCQPFSIQFNQNLLSHPMSDDFTVKTCSGDLITLAAEATFPNNGQNYTQTQANTRFIWHFGNGNLDTSAIINKTYFQAKGISFSLVAIDVNNCQSSNVLKGKIINSTNPIQSVNPVFDVLPNETIILNGSSVDPTATLLYSPISITEPILDNSYNYYDTVFLPDGNNISYNSDINIQSFLPNQTIQNVNQIVGIRLSMEHSYIGDLSIRITCPNGSTSLLKAQVPENANLTGAVNNPCSSGGGSGNLGIAIDPVSASNCFLTPGIGWDYEFRPGATHCMGTGGMATTYNYTDPCQNSLTGPTLVPSYTNPYMINGLEPVFYGSYETLDNLLGCPMNGLWRLTVIDHFAVDNGYIFNWGITLIDSLTPANWSYNIQIDTVLFIGENIQQIDPYTASLSLPNIGSYQYQVKTIDEFGCQYNANLMINCVLSIEDINLEDAIQAYPNPVQNFLHLDIMDQDWSNCTLEIYDASGKLVNRETLTSDHSQIDFSLYASGNYLARFINKENQIKAIKIIKMN